MMLMLVDSSVWIDLFRRDQTPQVLILKRQLGQEAVVIGDLILAEILQGICKAEVARVEAVLRPLYVVPLVGAEITRQSAANYRQLRRRGITVRKTIDCLIATWCIQNRVPLLHADRDFLPFVKLGLIEALQPSW